MPIDTKKLVSLKNAGVKNKHKWRVRGVDLSIAKGEIVTLIGPNGSGKSTTAKLALGIIKPNEGRLWRCAKLQAGYVPQKLSIDWTLPLTVSRFMNLTGRVETRQAHEALEATGALNLLNMQIRLLSGGEFQRVMLARAMALKPDLLVLDEPVQGVDFAGEIVIYDLIKTIKDKLGCGILLISHDLHIVMAETDKVICLNGHVCCSGSPKMVASSQSYKNLFGARAAPGLAIYEHKHDHTHLPDGTIRHNPEIKDHGLNNAG